MKKISIVTAYFNRKKHFYRTLKSIDKSLVKDIEVIVVDDCSNEEHRLEDLVIEFPFLKIIRLEKENKWYINPCIPFNIGIKKAEGDIIILQNPECFHFGDILNHVIENLNENDYITYACYSIDKSKTDILDSVNYDSENLFLELNEKIQPLPQHSVLQEGGLGWYNHSRIRPVGYHFTSAIHKKDLLEMGGFDERYALGIAYDDNEILTRIKRKGLNFKIIDSPYSIHQWHYDTNNFVQQAQNTVELLNRNKNLYYNITLKENTWKANVETK